MFVSFNPINRMFFFIRHFYMRLHLNHRPLPSRSPSFAALCPKIFWIFLSFSSGFEFLVLGIESPEWLGAKRYNGRTKECVEKASRLKISPLYFAAWWTVYSYESHSFHHDSPLCCCSTSVSFSAVVNVNRCEQQVLRGGVVGA